MIQHPRVKSNQKGAFSKIFFLFLPPVDGVLVVWYNKPILTDGERRDMNENPTNTPRIQAAIFDLDGTLLDSLGIWQPIDREFLAKRGYDLPSDYARAIATMHLHEAAEYTIRRFSLNEQADDVVDEWLRMARDAYENKVPLKAGAAEYLKRLKARGVRLAVATALARELAEVALQRHGLFEEFEAVVYTSEVGQGKSSPAVFLRAAERLNLSPEACAVFEDTLAGLRSAKAAGMQVFGVADDGAVGERDEIVALVDGYIENFADAPLFE